MPSGINGLLMKLDTEFIKLPLRFDVARLTEEATAFDEDAWRKHPTGYAGNSALLLISRNGEQNDDFSGPMKPAPALGSCPYMQQVLASFQTVYGRSRLMRLDPLSKVPMHADINYHWKNRVRIHIPIVTDPEISFICNDKSVHMAAGEAWIFNSWEQHTVINPTQVTRTHLVADTSGTPEFWRMVSNSERPFGFAQQKIPETRFVAYEPGKQVTLSTEQFTHPMIMSPGEVDGLAMELLSELEHKDNVTAQAFTQLVHEFRFRWRTTWYMYGPTQAGYARFQTIINSTRANLKNYPSLFLQSNGTKAANVFDTWFLDAALNVEQLVNPASSRTAVSNNQ
jgi:hypothetical protein